MDLFFTFQCLHQLHPVPMGTFSWLTPHIPTSMETISTEAELKCATMEPIVQYVMMDGQTVMLLWSAIK